MSLPYAHQPISYLIDIALLGTSNSAGIVMSIVYVEDSCRVIMYVFYEVSKPAD